MPFESPINSKVSGEDDLSPATKTEKLTFDEQREKFHAEIEFILANNAHKINEGNNGVIFVADLEQSPAIQEISKKLDLDEGLVERHVLKILKVYKPGEGRREFELQQKAYDILASAPEGVPVVKIPKPHFIEDVEIKSQAAIDMLKAAGLNNESVEVLFMEFVPGEDFATYFYRESLKRHKQFSMLQKLDEAGFAELHELVTQALNFKIYKGEERDPKMRALKEAKVENENQGKLYNHLRRTGIHIPEELIVRIENSLDLMHANGLSFGDGHERNFMIAGVDEKEVPDVFMVDFGGSITFEGDYESQKDDIYFDKVIGRRYIYDERIVALLRDLLPREGGELTESQEQMQAGLLKLSKRLSKNSQWKELMAVDDENIDDETLMNYVKEAQSLNRASAVQMSITQVLIKHFLNTGVISHTQAVEVLTSIDKQIRSLSPNPQLIKDSVRLLDE